MSRTWMSRMTLLVVAPLCLLSGCASNTYEGRWVLDRPAMREATEQRLAHRMGPERARKEVATGDTGIKIDMMGIDLRLEPDHTFTLTMMGPSGEEKTGSGTWREIDGGIELIAPIEGEDIIRMEREGQRLFAMQGDRELQVVLKKR